MGTYLDAQRQAAQAAGGGSQSRGGLLGIHLPKLGLGDLFHDYTVGLVTGLGHLATSLAPGGEPAGEVYSRFGKGLASSFLSTASTAAKTFGIPGTDISVADKIIEPLGGAILGEQYRPKDIYQRIREGQGVLPAVANDITNVAMGAGALTKLGSLSKVGQAAEALNAAERAAAAGATAADIQGTAEALSKVKGGFGKYGRAAAEAGAEASPQLKEAVKAFQKLQDKGITAESLDAAKVADRASYLSKLHAWQHPYQTMFNKVMRPLGKAATARELGDLPSEAPAVTEPVPAAAPVPEPATVGAPAMTPAEGFAALRDVQQAPGTTPIYRGGPAGDWWTTDLERAKSYGGEVQQVDVPNETLAQLQQATQEAARQGIGQPTAGDLYLGDAQALQQQARPINLEPQVTAEPGVPTAEHGPTPPQAFIDSLARQYAESRGLHEPTAVDTTAQVDPNRARLVSEAYKAAQHNPNDPAVRASFEAFQHDIKDQFDYLTKELGIDVQFVGPDGEYGIGTGGDVAQAHAEMMQDIMQNHRLRVRQSDIAGDAPNEFMAAVDPETGLTYNDMFRAVHDFFGHSRAENDFSRTGENVASMLHEQMFSDAAKPALFTETAGQNSYLNFDPGNVARKTLGLGAEFPEQKAALLPDFLRNPKVAEHMGPVEVMQRIRTTEGIPAWADKVVDKLPEFANRRLRKMDSLIVARQTASVLKERMRAQEVARRQELRSDPVWQTAQAALVHLVDRELPDGTVITRDVADNLIGDEIISRLDQTQALEFLVKQGADQEVVQAVEESFARVGARSDQRIPEQWLTNPDGSPTELGQAVDSAVEGFRAKEAQRLETLKATRKGAKGLETAGADVPGMSVGAQRLLKSALDDLAFADKLRRTRVPKEIEAQQRAIAEVGDDISRLTQEISRTEEARRNIVTAFDRTRRKIARAFRTDEDVARAVDEAHAEIVRSGGVTYDLNQMRPLRSVGDGGTDGGFAVGTVPDSAMQVPLTGNAVEDAVRIKEALHHVMLTYQDLFDTHSEVHLGAWVDEGVLHIDPSEIVGTRDEALLKGTARRQLSVYDMSRPSSGDPQAYVQMPGRPDITAQFLKRNNQRMRYAAELRRVLAKKKGITPEMIDAQMALNDLQAYAQWKADPGRWKHPDMVYATMRARMRGGKVPVAQNPQALLKATAKLLSWKDMNLGKGGFTPEVLAEATSMVDNLDEVSRWYHRTHEHVMSRYRKPDGTQYRVVLGNGKEVEVSDLMFQLLAVTSQQMQPGPNLAYGTKALTNYLDFLNEHGEANLSTFQKMFDEYLRQPAKAGTKFDKNSPRALSDIFQRLAGDTHMYAEAKSNVLQILAGETIDTWGDITKPSAEFTDAFTSRTQALRDSVPPEAQDLFDQVQADPTNTKLVNALRKAAPDLRPELKGSGDTWLVRAQQAARYEQGDVTTVERLQERMGLTPVQMSRKAALEQIDPEVVQRIGEDQAVMEFYGPNARAKYRSFYDNMRNPETSTAWTNDMWMGRIVGTNFSKPGEWLQHAEQGRALTEHLSDLLGRPVRPHEAQAVLWAYAQMEVERLSKEAHAEGRLVEPRPYTADFRDYQHHTETAKPIPSVKAALPALDAQIAKAVADGTLFNTLKQRILGAMLRGSDGQPNTLVFFQDADPVTLVHEHAHALRQIMNPSDVSVLERAFGVKNHEWTTQAEEAFAQAMEHYVGTGEAPTEGLKPYFGLVRKNLADQYHLVRDTLDIEPEVKSLMDRWFDPEKVPVDEASLMPEVKPDAFREVQVGGQNLRVGRSMGERAMGAPETAPETRTQTYRRGVEGGRAIEQDRAAQRKLAELSGRKARLEKQLEDMKRVLIEDQLPSQLQATRLESRAARRLERFERRLDNPNLSNVPAHWGPLWKSLKALHEEAKTNDALAQALEDANLPERFSTIVRIARENGFDPTHVRSFSPSEIRSLVFDNVQLGRKGRDLGKAIEAGTRKARVNPLARTRSLSALSAATIEATHELHTNALADYIEQVHARPVTGGTIPEGWVAWDAERNYLITGERTTEGGVKVAGRGAPTKMIPKEVKSVLDAYQRDYRHGIFNFVRKATDPWRLFILTLSPRWYVNNVIGNVVLTTKAGVNLQDWREAWRSFRKGDMPEGRLGRRFGAGSMSFTGPEAGAVAGELSREVGVRAEGTLIPARTGQGLGGVRANAREVYQATGRRMDAISEATSPLRRANEAVDELARVAVYFSGKRKGLTDAEALSQTFKAIVDYNDLSPFERQVVRSVVPFYSWQKGMLKLVSRFAVDHPIAVGLGLQLADLNRELQQDRYGTALPQGYDEMIDTPLGQFNLRPFNPFADASQLLSPQGIAASMNPFWDSATRNALGAPENGFADYQRINDFGSVVPDTSPAQDLTDMLRNLPITKPFVGDNGSMSGVQAGQQFVGARTYTPEQVQAIVDRVLKSQKQLGQ